MAGRRTNLALLLLLAAALGTGALAYAVGTAGNRWVVVAHGVVGVSILALAPWKQVIARRGVLRRREGWTLSLALAVVVAVALVFGVLHAAGIRLLGGLTSMQIHVGAAIVSVPFAIWHVVARKVRPRRVDLTRRNALRSVVLLGATGAVYVGSELLKGATGKAGADRRFTGSHEVGSFEPSEMPITQWFDDPVPAIDAGTWELVVRANGEARRLTHDELAGFGDRVRATIDCTGGWYATQDWEGARLSRLLPRNLDGRSVRFVSETGYGRRYPLTDVPHLLVATRVGGEPLSRGHGFPARLVAPGRRGFWWVKWLTEIVVDDAPWWAQPPFPVT